jgi:hypothetical protein
VRGPLAGLLLGQGRALLHLRLLPPGAGRLLLGRRLIPVGPGGADLRLLQVLARLLTLAFLPCAVALGDSQRDERQHDHDGDDDQHDHPGVHDIPPRSRQELYPTARPAETLRPRAAYLSALPACHSSHGMAQS